MKKILISVLLLAATGLYSCNDDDLTGQGAAGEPLTPGTEATFGVGLDGSAALSRTEYGDEINNAFPIYWTFYDPKATKPKDFDHILIQSPNARDGRKRAEYVVQPARPKYEGYCPVLAAEGEDGILFGGGQHAFYGFYPSSQIIKGKMDGLEETSIYAEMPSTQVVTYPASPDEDGMYVAEHNMDYCFMTSAIGNVTTKLVQLQFKPWASVLDITLPGPSESDAMASYKITEIVIRSLAQANLDSSEKAQEIAGSFKYDFTTDKIEFESVDGYDAPNHVLTIKIRDEEGNDGIVLEKGKKLNLKAFMLPVENLTGLSVEVSNGEGTMWSVTLKKPDNRTELLSKGHIHKVVLPALNSEKTQVDLSKWISGLKNMRITDMSIPGTYDSFSYLYTGTPQLQTIDINDQFQAGIRAFQVRVILRRQDEYIDGSGGSGDSHIVGNSKGHLFVTIDGKSSLLSLGRAVDLIYSALQENSPNDFCVLSIIHDEADTDVYNRDYYELLKVYADYFAAQGISTTAFAGDLTIDQLRGRILLQGCVNGGAPKALAEYRQTTESNNSLLCPYYNIENWIGNSGKTIIDHYGNTKNYDTDLTGNAYEDIGPKSWSPLDGAPMLLSWSTRYDDNIVGITPMTFGKIGSYTYNNISDASDYKMDGRSFITDIAIIRDANANRPAAPVPTNPEDKYGLAYINARVVYDGTVPQGDNLIVIPGYTPSDYDDSYNQQIRLAKTNVHFNQSFITDGTYGDWISSFSDNNFFWLADGYISYTEESARNAWNRVQYMWDGSYTNGGMALTAHANSGGRVLASTSIGTHATKDDFLRSNHSTPENVYDSNHLIFLAFLRLLINNRSAQEKMAWIADPGSGTKYNLNYAYNYTFNPLKPAFQSKPLGMIFMPCVPAKGVKIEKLNSFQNTDKHHARQLISFLVDHTIEQQQ